MQQRRRRILTLTLAMSSMLLAPSNYAASKGAEMSVEWLVPQDALTEASQVLHDKVVQPAGESPGSKSPAILFVLVGSVVIPYLAKTLVDIYRGRKGGVLIDTRTTPVKITHDSGLNGGVIIVISTQRTTVVDSSSVQAPSDLAKLLSISAR